MLRFIMTILLMAACFFAGKMSAQEVPDFQVVYEAQAPEITNQEIIALVRNPDLKAQFPDLYGKLMLLLATPQIQAQLINPNRANSPLYQTLVDLVALIEAKLNQ